LLIDVLDSMEAGQVWIADRNFCTALFLHQTAANKAYFLVRQHATNVRWEVAGELRKVGRTDTGMVYQQRVHLIDDWGNRLSARRITGLVVPGVRLAESPLVSCTPGPSHPDDAVPFE
jgi:hypothetical protein